MGAEVLAGSHPTFIMRLFTRKRRRRPAASGKRCEAMERRGRQANRERDELANQTDRDALLVILDMREITEARALDHVGAGRHGAAQGVLDTLGL